MAKAKEFKIHINGVKESFKDIGTLLERLEQVGRATSVQELNRQLETLKTIYKNLSAAERENSEIGGVLNKQIADLATECSSLETSIGKVDEALDPTSIDTYAKELEKLKAKYNKLSEEERNNAEVGGALSRQIGDLSDKHKELTRDIGDVLPTDSLESLEKKLKELKESYNQLSEEERNNASVGGALSQQIGELTDKHNELTRSVGDVLPVDSLAGLEKQIKELKEDYSKLTDEERNNLAVGGELSLQIGVLSRKHKELSEVMGDISPADSISGITKRIADLKIVYNELSKEQRDNTEVGVALNEEIESLTKQLKELNDELGNIDNLKDLKEHLGAAKDTLNGTKEALSLFGFETAGAELVLKKLASTMELINTIQKLTTFALDNSIKKNGLLIKVLTALGLAKKADTAETTRNIVAQNAQAAAQTGITAATGASTVAVKTFGKALVSTGIGILIAALGYLLSNFKEVKNEVVSVFPELQQLSVFFNELTAICIGVGDVIINLVLTPVKFLVQAIQGNFKEALAELESGYDVVGNFKKGYDKEIAKQDDERRKEESEKRVKALDDIIKDNEAKAGSDWKYSKEGQKAYRELYEEKRLLYAKDSEQLKILMREEASYFREVKSFQSSKSSGGGKSIYEKEREELEKFRQEYEKFLNSAEKLDLANNQRIIDNNIKQASSLTAKTKEELDIRNKAIIEAHNEQMTLFQKVSLAKIEAEKEASDRVIEEAIRLKMSEDEINALREAALIRHLDTKQQIYIAEQALHNEKNQDIQESNNQYLDSEKTALTKKQEDIKKALEEETELRQKQQEKIDELAKKAVVTFKHNNVVKIGETQKNLEEVKAELKKFEAELAASRSGIEKHYDSLLATYSADSEGYKKVLKEKEGALKSHDAQVKKVGKEIEANTEKTANLGYEQLKTAGENVKKLSESLKESITALFAGLADVMKDSLDDVQEQLAETTTKSDEVVGKRKESTDRLKALEEEQKNARGGRVLVLQEQINQEMESNRQLVNEEALLAAKKEKQEAEVAKKEKQAKKLKLSQSIVSSIASVAEGVVKAWGLGPILGPIMATLVGVSGAAQVLIMTKQLAKLEDGGLLNGKRHAQGGMRVEGTNIEVEGGEYVVNRESTNKNIDLIKYINSQRKRLEPNDINSFFGKTSQGFEPPFKRMFEAGGQLPSISNSPSVDNDLLIEAIQSIKIEPKVSVSDINRAQENMVSVDNWTGM